MDKKLQAVLFKKYKKIFKQRKSPITKSCMGWGITCGDGWYWLIDALCSHLQFCIDKNKYPALEATQVKEKFGTLRFYTTTHNAEQEAVIQFVETLSASICEICGTTKDVKLRKGAWMRTLCKTCHLDKKTK